MKINKFEDVIAWQKARELSLLIYSLFHSNKDYDFRSQIIRATISIMNNIAEGFERGTDKDFKNFLYIARGSCSEVRSMLYMAKDLGYLSQPHFNNCYDLTTEIGKIINGFIKKL